MVKKLFITIALALGLLFVAQADKADAAWRCGPAACWWTPGYVGVVPNYAIGWGPPRYSHCYWKLNRKGNWKYKC